MAKIPVIKNLRQEDFPKEESWVSALLSPLNIFINYVVLALNRGLTFQDNLTSQLQTLNFTYQPNSFPIILGRVLTNSPSYGIIGYSTENGIGIGAVMNWDLTESAQVRINNISMFTYISY